MISGWYDLFLPLQLRDYARLVAAGRPPRLTVGPWGHGSPRMKVEAVAEAAEFLKEQFGGKRGSGVIRR